MLTEIEVVFAFPLHHVQMSKWHLQSELIILCYLIFSFQLQLY